MENILLNSKCTKRTEIEIAELIQSLLQASFRFVEPTKEEQNLYNRYSETTFEEEKNEQVDLLKADFSEMLKYNFGVNVDLGDLDMENE